MKHWINAVVIGVVLAYSGTTYSGTAYAQDAAEQEALPLLSAEFLVQKVEVSAEDGKEALVTAETAFPGDLLQYSGVYTNNTEEPLAGLIVNGPIPASTAYQVEGTGASQDAVFEVQVKDEDWQVPPAYKTIVLEDGTEKRVVAEPWEYLQIRWRIADALAPKANLTTVYRVKVND